MIEDLSTLPGLEHAPWISRYRAGPHRRAVSESDPRHALGHHSRRALCGPDRCPWSRWRRIVKGLIEEQQRAEEEQASQQSLKAIQKAFHEAMLALPREEYDWFDVHAPRTPGARDAGELAPRRRAAGRQPTMRRRMLRPGVAEPSPCRIAAASSSSITRAPCQRRGLAGGEHHAAQRDAKFPGTPARSLATAGGGGSDLHLGIADGGGSLSSTHGSRSRVSSPGTPGLAR